MKNRSLYAVLTRFGIVAAMLTALLVIAPVGAQTEEEADPCSMNAGVLECGYDEIGTDPVATFESSDPEGEGIDWSLDGVDAADFDITGGVLTFKKSPNFEAPSDRIREDDTDTADVDESDAAGNNVYLVTVVATEMLAAGQEPPAETNELDVQVTVNDVDEPGTITLSRLQPQVQVALTATLSDPDGGPDPAQPNTPYHRLR